ncbi:MAG: hypothetical protein RL548_1494 [Bacteroidota bacterium]
MFDNHRDEEGGDIHELTPILKKMILKESSSTLTKRMK